MRVRRAVMRSLSVVLVPVAALTLAGCGDDGEQTWVTGTPAPTTSTTSTTTTTTEAPQEQDESAIQFEARRSVSGGAPWIEIEITSDAPEGTAAWAIEVNGQVAVRTGVDAGDRFGFRVADVEVDEPIEITVIAESAGRQALAESAPVTLS